jgi:hypothetical protein
MFQETFDEENPPINDQQTANQNKLHHFFIEVQKRWTKLVQWIDTPPKCDHPPLPPDFWGRLRSPPEERSRTNQADEDEQPEEISNGFYGDHWMIIVFLSLFFVLAGIWLLTVMALFLAGK